MNNVDYDPNEFYVDEYGNLIPKNEGGITLDDLTDDEE